jgi:hypothetical protein
METFAGTVILGVHGNRDVNLGNMGVGDRDQESAPQSLPPPSGHLYPEDSGDDLVKSFLK